jgi:hypothetical protein
LLVLKWKIDIYAWWRDNEERGRRREELVKNYLKERYGDSNAIKVRDREGYDIDIHS